MRLQKHILVVMTLIFLLSFLLPSMRAFADDSTQESYFLMTAVNYTNLRYEGIIMPEYNVKKGKEHKEQQIEGFSNSAKTIRDQGIPTAGISQTFTNGNQLQKLKDFWSGTNSNYWSSATNDGAMIATFPSFHNELWDATGEDLRQAEFLANNVVEDFNKALRLIAGSAAGQTTREEMLWIGHWLAQTPKHRTSFNYHGKAITFNALGSDHPANLYENKEFGITKANYVEMKIGGVSQGTFMVSAPKGYAPGQRLHANNPLDYKDAATVGLQPDYTWEHVVMIAHRAFFKLNIAYETVSQIQAPTMSEQEMTNMSANVLTMLRSMLKLQAISDLVFNNGKIGSNGYFYGIMPKAWLESASLLHWVSMALSWILLMGAIARLLFMRTVGALNLNSRVSLIEGVKSLFIVGLALTLYNPLFLIISNLNWLIVDIFKNTSENTLSFGLASLSTGFLAGILLGFVYFIIDIYFNFVYLARAITTSLLYGVGPLFIVSIAFGTKYAQMFSTYTKEMLGTIFIQSFHSIIIAFFTMFMVFNTLSTLEQFVICFSIIPLTKFFREALGLGGGVIDSIGGGSLGAAVDVSKGGVSKAKGKASQYGKTSASKVGAMMDKNKQGGSSIGGGGTNAAGNSGSMVQVDKSSTTSSAGGNGTVSGNPSSAAQSNTTGSATSSTTSSATGNTTGSMPRDAESNAFKRGYDEMGPQGRSLAMEVGRNATKGGSFTASAGIGAGMAAVGQGSTAQHMNGLHGKHRPVPNNRPQRITEKGNEIEQEKQQAVEEARRMQALSTKNLKDDE